MDDTVVFNGNGSEGREREKEESRRASGLGRAIEGFELWKSFSISIIITKHSITVTKKE